MIHFDISKIEQKLNDLEKQTMQENFWNDSKNSSKVLSKIKQLKLKCIEYEKIMTEISYLKELSELANLELNELILNRLIQLRSNSE